MTLTIWGVVATIVSLGAWLLKRQINKADDPETIAEKRREAFHENLFKGDSVAESVRVDDLVREIKNQNHIDGSGGSNSQAG